MVLDYLPQGYSAMSSREPLAQLMGVKYFTLLEVSLKTDVDIGEKVYVGKGDRDKIKFIKRRIKYDQLTNSAKTYLPEIVEKIVSEDEKRFVDFFNKAGPITVRQHQLELLNGVGKKHMKQILEEREKKPFESFEDLEKRISQLPSPKRMIVDRILDELKGSTKYFIFVRPFTRRY